MFSCTAPAYEEPCDFHTQRNQTRLNGMPLKANYLKKKITSRKGTRSGRTIEGRPVIKKAQFKPSKCVPEPIYEAATLPLGDGDHARAGNER